METAGKETDSLKSIPASEFASELKSGKLAVLDVRKPTEFQSEHVENAQNFPLDFINDNFDELDKDQTYHVHCAGGYRSVIAASIMKSRGVHNLVDIAGGFKAISETDIPRTDYICPTTLK